MKRTIFATSAVVAVLALFGLAPAASADHACDSNVVDVGGALYVVVDNLENNHGSIWIYQESNGQAGLQRDDDSCAGHPEQTGDTVIF